MDHYYLTGVFENSGSTSDDRDRTCIHKIQTRINTRNDTTLKAPVKYEIITHDFTRPTDIKKVNVLTLKG